MQSGEFRPFTVAAFKFQSQRYNLNNVPRGQLIGFQFFIHYMFSYGFQMNMIKRILDTIDNVRAL